MAECIERESLMVALCKEITGAGDYYNGKDDMQDQIRDMVSQFPVADVAPVRHGRWIDGDPYCPICRKDKFRGLDADIWADWQPPYCPNCGAKMDLVNYEEMQ